MRSASPVVFLALLFTNGEAFSVVKPSVSSGLYQQPTFAKATQLFAGQDSFPTAVLEKESITTQVGTDAVKETPTAGTDVAPTETVEELSETQKLMQQVKDAGTAGVISYALWELGFWAISVPVVLFGYFSVTGHLPDLSNKEDTAKLGAEAFAFVNFARFAVPLRIGLALSTTPWIQANILDRFFSKEEDKEEVPFQ